MDNHWAITTSSGRRVSLLCEEQTDYAASYAGSASSPTPPPSPDYRRPYAPFRADSISSACSSTSSLATVSSQGLYSPQTPPSTMSLPPLDKLLPVPEKVTMHDKYAPAVLDSPLLAPTIAAAPAIDGSLSPVSAHANTTTTTSTPPSPKALAANSPSVKRSSRRYACHCGKSFTTSGHLARHTRIHTGEKNYKCPEAGCSARFSRQDNCMQHYRTHQGGSGGKRATRKRRSSVEVPPSPNEAPESTRQQPSPSVSRDAPTPAAEMHQQSYSVHEPPFVYPNYFEPFGSDGGLAALANVACSGYS